MTLEPSNNPKSGGSQRTPEPPKSNSEPAHRQIQSAHDRYFQDLAMTWNATAQRFQNIQTDYERSLEKAWQAQDPNGCQTAQAESQRALQATCTEGSPAGDYDEAYRKYKAAVRKALSDANPDDLNFTDMAHLSQSLTMVSQMAMMLMQTGPIAGSGSGPFQPASAGPGGGTGPLPPAGTAPPTQK
jgi:hypothetical protein